MPSEQPSAAPAPTSDMITAAVPLAASAVDAPAVSAAAPATQRRAVEMPAAVPRSITRPGTPAPTLVMTPLPRDPPISATMTAVPAPAPSSTRQSAPTEIGGLIVEPLPALESDGEPLSDSAIEIVAATPERDDASARTQIHAGAPRPEPPALPASVHPIRTLPGGLTPIAPSVASPRPTFPEVEIAEPTDLWVGPPEPASPDSDGATSPEESTSPEDAALPEESTSPEAATSPEDAAPHRDASASDAGVSRPRRTVIGVVVTPPGVTVLPAPARTQITDAVSPDDGEAGEAPGAQAAPGDRSVLASEEPTGADRVIGDRAVDFAAPTIRPEPQSWPTSETPLPSNDWTMPPAKLAGHNVPAPAAAPIARAAAAPPAPLTSSAAAAVQAAPAASAASAAPDIAPSPGDWIMPPAKLAGLAEARAEPIAAAQPAAPPGLPSGDWTIALDPQAPDGWSAPFQLVSPSQIVGEPAPMAAAANASNARPFDVAPARPPARSDEITAAEPKVQIDPTLIEPLQPMPPDGLLRPMPPDGPSRPVAPEELLFRHPAASSQDIPLYASPPAASAIEAPPMNAMMAVPQQPPFMAHPGQPMMHPGQVPGYPMDPGYPVVPMAMSPMQPLTAGGSGSRLVDPRYPSAHRLQAHSGRRHAIIVIVSALVAVVIGIIVLVVLGAGRDSGPVDSAPDPRGPQHGQASQTQDPQGSAATATRAQPAGSGSAESPATRGDHTTRPVPAASASPAPQATLTCFANVTSQPSGAEIVIDDTNVLGTTPQKIELPCGGPTELVIRKSRMVAATRTVTPTPDGVTVKVWLAKLTFLVKVSSTPAGATVTVNGKQLGVTPTTVKVPAFEPSILAIAKDGYVPETEKVTPKTSGVAVHTVLQRLAPAKLR